MTPMKSTSNNAQEFDTLSFEIDKYTVGFPLDFLKLNNTMVHVHPTVLILQSATEK